MHERPDKPTRRGLLRAAPALVLSACASPQEAAKAPLPQVAVGRIERLASLTSRFVAPRHVDVWLPRGYDGSRPHSVVYMHDGQMLFDASTTWNKQAWNVHSTVQRLIDEGRLPDLIVVGVWNSGATRFQEYFPAGFVPHLAPAARELLMRRGLNGRPLADAYLRFVVQELKPAIDARFRTRPARQHTHIAGSSMGGLVSMYALCEHPQVFGGAAAMSTHWIGGYERNAEVPAAALAYLRDKLPPPGQHRIWMDRGTTELDAQYDQAQPLIDALMRDKGFGPPGFVSRVFEGTGHNERAWAERLALPLQHLLGA